MAKCAALRCARQDRPARQLLEQTEQRAFEHDEVWRVRGVGVPSKSRWVRSAPQVEALRLSNWPT